MKPNHPARPTLRTLLLLAPRRAWLPWALALGLLTALTPAQAARLALVVGNDSYQHVATLRNAVADAQTMAQALQQAGYQVSLSTNRDLKTLKDDLRAFKRRIQGGDEVVLYFSGHGVQLGGDNYLLPVDVRSDNEDQVRDDALTLSGLLADVRAARPVFTLAIIDACRDNPFQKGGKSIGGRGLNRPTAGATGEMVMFAAGEGQQALDRLGERDPVKNGVFTRVLVKEMQRPGVPVDQVLKNVRVEVNRLAQTVRHEQVPALYDQVLGNFYFYPPGSSNRTRPADEVVADVGVVPAEAPPVPRPVGGVNLADLKKAEQARQAWAQWQARMQADYNEAAAFTGSPDLRVQAWGRFLEAWKEDNPNSGEDEGLRTQATGKLGQARAEVAQQAQQAQATQTLDGRYQILAGGAEVKDLETGLVWQRCSVGQSWSGSSCTGKAQTFTFEQAQMQGGNGWRVPAVRELQSLRVCSKGFKSSMRDLEDGRAQVPLQCADGSDRPTIHKGAFLQMPVTVFWSSSPYGDGYAWGVNFDGGSVSGGNRLYAFAVRLVRASQ